MHWLKIIFQRVLNYKMVDLDNPWIFLAQLSKNSHYTVAKLRWSVWELLSINCQTRWARCQEGFPIVTCLPWTHAQQEKPGLMSHCQTDALSVHSICANIVCDILTKICQKNYLNVEAYHFTSLPLIPVKIL